MTREGLFVSISRDLSDVEGVSWASLHSPDAGLGASDIDIAASVPGGRLVELISGAGRASSYAVIASVNYDIGRGDTYWLWDLTDGAVLQVDVLCDPRGIGRLGFPTEPYLAAVSSGSEADARAWSFAYELSKRAGRAEWGRLARWPVALLSPETMAPPLECVLGPRTAGLVTAELASESPQLQALGARIRSSIRRGRYRRARGGVLGIGVQRLRRIVRRLVSPVGSWAHFHGPEAQGLAVMCHRELASAFPRAVTREVRRPLWSQPFEWVRILVMVRRPSLIVTWSRGPAPVGNRAVKVSAGPDCDWVERRAELARRWESRVRRALR